MSKTPFIVSAAIVLIGLPALASAEIHMVTVGDNFFSPNDLTIQAGDTVRWTNAAGGAPHDVTADDFSFASTTASSFTFDRVFNSAGEVLYFCTVHSSPGQNRNSKMNGRITVEAATPVVDLALQTVNAPAGPFEQGENFKVSITTTNFGDLASGSYTVNLYASANSQVTSGDTSIGASNRAGLAAGAQDSFNAAVTIPATLAPGNYFIGGIIGINDADNSNNSKVDNAAITVVEASSEIFPINAGLNGNWYGGEVRNFEGIQIEISAGDGSNLDLVATFYTYDTMGNQIFLLMIGDVSGDTAEVVVYIYVNGLWGDDFDTLLVEETQWGTGTIRAFSCEAMEMDLRPNDEYMALGYTDLLMYDLVRLPSIVPVVPCPIPNP